MNLAISFDSSVFEVPGGPKKIADLGVPFLNGRPSAITSASSEIGLTNCSHKYPFKERGMPWTSIVLSRKPFAKVEILSRSADSGKDSSKQRNGSRRTASAK